MPITAERMIRILDAANDLMQQSLGFVETVRVVAANQKRIRQAAKDMGGEGGINLLDEICEQNIELLRKLMPDSRAIETISSERAKFYANKKRNIRHSDYMRSRRIANRDINSDEREVSELFGEETRAPVSLPTSAIPLRLEPIGLPELREHLWSKFGTGIIYQSQVAEELAALGEPNLPEQIRIIKELLESDLAKPGEFAGEILLTQEQIL